MDLERHAEPATFAALVRPSLLVDEARHNLFLGVLGALEQGLHDPGAAWMVAVTDGGALVAAALRTPPWPWAVAWFAAQAPNGAQAADIVAKLAALGAEFRGVTSDVHTAQGLAAAWCDRFGGTPRQTMAMRIMQATAVRPPDPPPPGHPRPATPADARWVHAWGWAFAREALAGDAPEQFAAAQVRYLNTGQFRYWLWIDREPVAMGAIGAPTGTGERVGGMYTPPRWRGRGYAGALVAAMTADGFDRGLERVLLFTDATNPTSNRVYARVGYEDVGGAARWDVSGSCAGGAARRR